MIAIRRIFSFVLLLLPCLGFAQSPAVSSPNLAIKPFEVKSDSLKSTSLSQSLETNYANALAKKGFSIVELKPENAIRFEASGILVLEEGNLILQLQIVDVPYRTVVASDMVSVVYGLTSLDVLNESLSNVAKQASDYWAATLVTPLPVPPMLDSVVFLSADSDAEIFWRGHESIGKVTEGKLAAPYYPFPSNSDISVTIEKTGYQSKTTTVHLVPAQIEYALPKLDKLRIEELLVGTSSGRLLGIGAQYRRYFLPDYAFWAVEAHPFLQARPGSATRPTLHLDLGATAGSYFFFGADNWFRFGFESGLMLHNTVTQAAQTPGYYLDVSVLPLGLIVEWNFFGITIENQLRVPYALGITPNGVLGQKWLMVGESPMLSIGTVLKW